MVGRGKLREGKWQINGFNLEAENGELKGHGSLTSVITKNVGVKKSTKPNTQKNVQKYE